jgi:hypothetical protein
MCPGCQISVRVDMDQAPYSVLIAENPASSATETRFPEPDPFTLNRDLNLDARWSVEESLSRCGYGCSRRSAPTETIAQTGLHCRDCHTEIFWPAGHAVQLGIGRTPTRGVLHGCRSIWHDLHVGKFGGTNRPGDGEISGVGWSDHMGAHTTRAAARMRG